MCFQSQEFEKNEEYSWYSNHLQQKDTNLTNESNSLSSWCFQETQHEARQAQGNRFFNEWIWCFSLSWTWRRENRSAWVSTSHWKSHVCCNSHLTQHRLCFQSTKSIFQRFCRTSWTRFEEVDVIRLFHHWFRHHVRSQWKHEVSRILWLRLRLRQTKLQVDSRLHLHAWWRISLLNELKAKVRCHINHRDRVHDFINLRQEESMNQSSAQEHESDKVLEYQSQSRRYSWEDYSSICLTHAAQRR